MSTIALPVSTILLGHRGARGEAPENTLAGFAYTQALLQQSQRCGKRLGGVELDVQLSKDGKLMVHHDADLKRTCGRPLYVSELSAARLKATHQTKLVGGKNLHKPHLCHICSLDEVLPYLRGYRHIELEVKTNTCNDNVRSNLAKLVTALSTELTQQSYQNLPITLTSFDTKLLEKLVNADMPFRRGLLVDKPAQAMSAQTMSAQALVFTAKRLGVRQIGVYYPFITKALVKLAHQHRLRVTAWTVNDVAHAHTLAQYGVDCVITDFPSRFIGLAN